MAETTEIMAQLKRQYVAIFHADGNCMTTNFDSSGEDRPGKNLLEERTGAVLLINPILPRCFDQMKGYRRQ